MERHYAYILAFSGLLFCQTSGVAQSKSDLKVNPFMLFYGPMPSLMYERIYGSRTSWEVAIMFNRTSTCTTVHPTQNFCYNSSRYTYLGGYAAWRWYPFGKPGTARWIFLGVAAAYGGGISLPNDVYSFFYNYAKDPRFVDQHSQGKLFLGPMGGVKLMEGRRISMEGLICFSPYYKKSEAPFPLTGMAGFGLNYRIYH